MKAVKLSYDKLTYVLYTENRNKSSFLSYDAIESYGHENHA